jgi:proline dehydrogenase
VRRIARRHGVSAEEIGRSVARRATRLRGVAGWLGGRNLARTVDFSLALGAAERRFADFLASGARHVSGLTIEDAIEAARCEARSQHTATLGYWPQPGEAPESVARAYTEAVAAVAALKTWGAGCATVAPGGPDGDAIAPSSPPVAPWGVAAWSRIGAPSISVKPDHLAFQPQHLRSVLEAAREQGVRVHFDAQSFDTAEPTLDCVEQALAADTDVSATLPARWRRSAQDAERIVRWGIPVRVVKGQGADPGDPKIDPRRAFLELVERLAGRAAHVAVATHDRRTAEPALLMLRATRTPCSLEQLRSLPRLDALALALDVPMRVYVAYGRFGLPYAVGEVLRRPAIAAWVLRDLLVRHRPAASVTPPRGMS